MKKIIPFLIELLFFSVSYEVILNNIKVNGGNYGDSFIFTLSGTAKEDIFESSNIIIKILVGEEEKEASCSVNNADSGENAIYYCILEETILEIKPALKKDQENNIFEISENVDIEPVTLEIKYLEAKNLNFFNNYWIFDLKGETDISILSKSLTYMDINVDDSNEVAGCLFSSKEENKVLFKCKINMNNQMIDHKIIIPKIKTDKSSLTFKPELQKDENIIVFKSLNFIQGYNLLFNSNNKWEFFVNFSSESLPIGSKCSIDILYNDISSTATCYTTSNYYLKCYPDEEEQSIFDLVKINYLKSEKSTISWTDLTSIYEIPICKKLKYSRLYDLTYLEKKWHFKILLNEKSLPENALIKVDILFTIDENKNSATCYHSNSILNCVVDATSQSSSNLVQLSAIKKYGSIEWENPKISDRIEFIVTLTYKDSYDLDFIDNRWNFTLKADTNVNIPNHSFVVINIKYGQAKKNGKANCIVQGYNSVEFKCEVIYENQNINDLILISNSTEGISCSWKSGTDQEIPITLLASLNLVKTYDLLYSNKKWSFKIEIEDTLPEESKIILDIFKYSNNKGTATCFYNNKILSCLRDDSSQSSTDLVRLRKEKSSGSIKWLNIKEDEVPIPLITTLTFSKAYGLFFTDLWKFIIEASSPDISIPSGSNVIIDILQNSKEEKASCFVEGGVKAKISNLTCSGIGNNQLKTDNIKINTNKKFASVTWNFLTTSNNNIAIAIKNDISLSFIDAYDMVFSNNTWLFKIIGKPTTTIWGGGIYVTDINYISTSGIFDSTATCWTQGGTKADNIIFLCAADYEGQTQNDLVQIRYPKTDKSSITWTTGINDNYQITLKTSLILVKAYDLIFDKIWKFKIEVDGGLLPPGAKVIIDTYRNNDLLTTNCSSLNNKLILCNTEFSSSGYKVKLTKEKSKKSSVEWVGNLQNDYLISLKVELTFGNVYNMHFDEINNKWNFQISKDSGSMPTGSKIIIDILYDNLPSTATCYYNDPKIDCTVDEESQDKKKLVKISHIKTDKSTVTWSNLEEDKNLYLECNLNFIKAENLRYENSIWAFDIYVSNEDIPKYSNVIVDINAGSYYNTAKCIINNKKLNCKTSYSTNTLISLRSYKSKTSTVTWDNLDEDIYIFITTKISYQSFGKIQLSNNKYTFTCYYSGSYIPNEGKVIMDIIIGNTPSTTICTGQGNYNLLCEINEENYINPFIYISKTKSDKSTITWLNLDSNKSITNIELGFLAAYNKEFVDDKFIFRILTYDNRLPNNNNTQIPVVVRYSETDTYKIDYEIPCTNLNDILYCTIDIQNQKVTDNFELFLPKDNSRDIKWKNGNNNYVKVSSFINIKFLRMNSFEYNKNNKNYYFSILIENSNYENIYSDESIVMDISINDDNTYAKCDLANNNENKVITCTTKIIDYNLNNQIKIIANKNLGNINWDNMANEKIISDSYFGQILYLYDLYFDVNKWNFKIKLVKPETLEKKRTLDILISGKKGIASCQLSTGILSCQVEEENQNNSQLIQLSKEAFSGSLQLSNIENNKIPLKISLLFNKAYNLEYNKIKGEWNFMVEAEINQNDNIPKDSYFSIDIKYQKSSIVYNEIAYCSYQNEISNNIIKLLCTPEKKIAKNLLIMINKNKSEYTSISWIKDIPDENLEMLITAELNVLEVNNLRFDTINNKWSFQMNIGYDEYPLNSNFLIDMEYNGKNSTALCTFNSENNLNYLLCFPEIDEQNENDYFEILYINNKGTVTYSNIKSKLFFKIVIKLKFIKAYDLYFNDNQKWEFKIKVSDSNLPNGKTTIVDVSIGYYSSTAECRMDNNILYCEVLYNYQNEFNEIKLLNIKNNGYVEWQNLDNEKEIYSKCKLKYIFSYGEFSENKWKLNIKYELINPAHLSNTNKLLLDILVNEEEATAICDVYYLYNYLICESTHNNQNENDVIEISGNTTPNFGTIYWNQNLESDQKKLNELKLNLEYSSISYGIRNNRINFYIKGHTSKENYYEIIENSKINIEILVNTTGSIEKTNSICLTNDIDASKGSYVYLSCSSDYTYDINTIYLSIDSNGFSNDVEFENKKENILFYSSYNYNNGNDNKENNINSDNNEYNSNNDGSNNDKINTPTDSENKKEVDNNNNTHDKNSSKYICIFNLFIIFLIL